MEDHGASGRSGGPVRRPRRLPAGSKAATEALIDPKIDPRLVWHLVFDCLSPPILVTQAAGQVHFANEAALEVLKNGRGLVLRDGRLQCAHGPTNIRLLEALKTAGQAAWSQTMGLAIQSLDGDPLFITLTTLAAEPAPHLLLLVQTPADTEIHGRVLCELYGATAAEARVAIALLMGGTVKEYAAHSGASEHTVRTQLKQLMAKMGVRRQSDLMRMIISGPLGWLRLYPARRPAFGPMTAREATEIVEL